MSRARYPDEEGFVERDGVRVFWERYGEGDTTILMLPAWSVCYSRLWKGQIPYLARHFRVLAFDPRGNGRSDKPADPEAYADQEIVDDALAVMDATGTERAILVGASMGGWLGAILAGMHPDRVDGAFLMCPASQLGDPLPERGQSRSWTRSKPTRAGGGSSTATTGCGTSTASRTSSRPSASTERHSTRQVEDMAGWIRETTPESLIASVICPGFPDSARARAPATSTSGSSGR